MFFVQTSTLSKEHSISIHEGSNMEGFCKQNDLLGAKGPPLVGEEVRKEDVDKVGS
jgi:hypothetical protein